MPLSRLGLRGYLSMLLLASLAVVGFSTFFWVEKRAEKPIVLPMLLRLPAMRAVAILAMATGFVEATMVFLPTLAVAAFDVSAQRASLMLLPLIGALIAGSVIAGRLLDKVGAAPIIRFGMGLIVVGLLVLGLPDPDRVSFYAGGLAVGLGLASLLGAPLRFVVQRLTGRQGAGAGQGMLTVFLGIGRLAGAALIGGLVPAGDIETVGFRYAMLSVALVCGLSLVTTGWLTKLGDNPRKGETDARLRS